MNNPIIARVWITKYALTQGVYVLCDAEEHLAMHSMTDIEHMAHNMISARDQFDTKIYFHGKDWHRTKADALARAEQMRRNKIASLKKQIAKLEKLTFVAEDGPR